MNVIIARLNLSNAPQRIDVNDFKLKFKTMENIELAKWLHDNYEEVAKDKDWNTQENCKVEFDTLPDANKRTMIEIANRLLNFNLLRLHFVSDSYCVINTDKNILAKGNANDCCKYANLIKNVMVADKDKNICWEWFSTDKKWVAFP